jgi:hypothetical protein
MLEIDAGLPHPGILCEQIEDAHARSPAFGYGEGAKRRKPGVRHNVAQCG